MLILRSLLAPLPALLFCALAFQGLAAPAAECRDLPSGTAPAAEHVASLRWPAGTITTRFENLEGLILVEGRLGGTGVRDTTGLLALDTGAGYLALDAALSRGLGITDATPTTDAAGAIEIAPRPLPRLGLGELELQSVTPVLTVDAEIVRRATDRPVLGLLGANLFERFVLVIDYREEWIAMIPGMKSRAPASSSEAAASSRAALAGVMSTRAMAVAFRLVGDGKVLVRARVSNPRPPRKSAWLTLIVDTGATKTVLFESALESLAPRGDEWPRLRGLSAPTLIGEARASIARIPEMEVRGDRGDVRQRNLDVAVIESQLAALLSGAAGEPVHGLLGYSFLKHYRLWIDFPLRTMWLDPLPPAWDHRELEYCHVGLQIERRGGAATVAAVADSSPAAREGIAVGDELVAVDGEASRGVDIASLSLRLEGEPGTHVSLTLRRGTLERTCRLVRRRLL